MCKEHYEKFFYNELVPTSACVKLANKSFRYVAGVACDLLVKIRNNYVSADFTILDMGNMDDITLILG